MPTNAREKCVGPAPITAPDRPNRADSPCRTLTATEPLSQYRLSSAPRAAEIGPRAATGTLENPVRPVRSVDPDNPPVLNASTKATEQPTILAIAVTHRCTPQGLKVRIIGALKRLPSAPEVSDREEDEVLNRCTVLLDISAMTRCPGSPRSTPLPHNPRRSSPTVNTSSGRSIRKIDAPTRRQTTDAPETNAVATTRPYTQECSLALRALGGSPERIQSGDMPAADERDLALRG